MPPEEMPSTNHLCNVVAGAVGPQRMTLTLTADVPAGTLLRLRASDLGALGSLPIEVVRAAGHALEAVHHFSPERQARDWMFFIYTLSMAVVRAQVDLPAGTELVIDLAKSPASNVSGLTWTVVAGIVETVESHHCEVVSNAAGFHFVAAEAETIEAFRNSAGAVAVRYFDAFGNPAEPDAPATRTPVGTDLRVTVTDRAGHAAVSNPTPVTESGPNVYFGDIHWHCRVSCDGQRLLPDALVSARDELCLDFATASDHMMPDGRYLSEFDAQYQADVCRSVDEPGRFCTLPTAEFGSKRGHANLICDSFETFLALTGSLKSALGQYDLFLPDPRALIPLCPPGRAMIVPHHTTLGADAADVDAGKALWGVAQFEDPPEKVIMRLIEIVQSSGSHAMEDIDERWLCPRVGRGASAATALAAGYRLGFTGGTDNHQGWAWRGKGLPGTGGLTAVLADTLDTASLFSALHARRCYATSGPRIVAEATLNGHPIGSELTLAPEMPRAFEIRIHATAPLTDVQIICIDTVVAELPVPAGAMDFEAAWTDEEATHTCYYVRARQEDGHCLFMSPWWIDAG